MAPQTPEPTTTNPQTAPQALLPTGLAPARSDLDLATQSPRGPSTCVSNPGTDQSRLPSDSPPTNKELSPNVGTTCSQDEVVPSHEDVPSNPERPSEAPLLITDPSSFDYMSGGKI
ncbi:hypothetical protein PtA15_1A75 [Puccinia triticina]|uniref:Uncharacterized protein n=1 Tax=Puccinia triticina TaxID=208348 RepID=A0ABY7C8G0_9BASI|nr:uncharacterized protein PtA15_1A75 [Puccinia triticina]WAQ80737.1 hypothetical protein PtA15_1A75 [Puccinia triticina]